MGSVTRTGYFLEDPSQDVKKNLTVRAIVNSDIGFPPPPFKVFKQSKTSKGIWVPLYYGLETFGPCLHDKRPEPVRVSATFVGKLRDETHQNEAFSKAVSLGHGVLSLPCGFGKTTVALAIACKLGLRTMIIVHKEFLANQWRERIQQFCPGATIGIVQRDRINVDTDFVIAMLQSLSMKEYSFEQFETIGTVFVDEAHHICAEVFSRSLFKMCPRHLFGLSATPDRKDGLTKVLHWFMGPTILSVERENQKQVCVFPIQFDCPQFKECPPTTRFGKLCLAEMINLLTYNEERNRLLVDLIRKASTGRHLLVLSDRRAHCEWLHSQFPENSGLYMGGMKQQQLEESSQKNIIIGTFSQAHEGLDIPSLDTVILATPKSDIKQSIGRILRETTGKKNDPHIYDICDHWSILFSMYTKRKRVYQQGGFVDKSDPQKVEAIPFKGKCIL